MDSQAGFMRGDWDTALYGNIGLLSIGVSGLLFEPAAPAASGTISVTEINGVPIYDYLMDVVKHADFSTPHNGAFFWSGYEIGNQQSAMAMAKACGGSTIEMTQGGKWLTSLDLYGAKTTVTREQANAIWNAASESFAKSATGDVFCFTKGTLPNPNSIFYGTELPILKGNPNVTSLIYLFH